MVSFQNYLVRRRRATEMVRVLVLNLVLLFFAAGTAVTENEGTESISEEPLTHRHLEIYKSLFSLKRKEQIETAEKVWEIDDYAKQFKTITFVMDAIFPVLEDAKTKITKSKYTPDLPFPEEQEIQEVLGNIYENVIFFGDFLLRMPDMIKKIYKKHKEWHPIFKWAMEFCSQSKEIFSGPHATQLHLMAQEIGLIPEDPNYHNPFRVSSQLRDNKRKKTPPKEKRSGPKLRGGRHSEL